MHHGKVISVIGRHTKGSLGLLQAALSAKTEMTSRDSTGRHLVLYLEE